MAELTTLCVLGLARSGRAVAQYAAARMGEEFSRVVVYDGADTEQLRALAAELTAQGVEVELGASGGDDRFDLCVASPGIPPHAAIFAWARSASSRMISEIEFAYERSVSPWLAVTGTNGKTTTTSLVAHLLEMGGVATRTVGNIGAPAIEQIGDASPGTAIVAEVSSFQLALTDRFCPRVAVLLNITPDHIDWHGSMESYESDKTRVFENMGEEDTAVIDVDDPGSAPWAEKLAQRGVRVVRVSRRGLHPGGAGLSESGALALDTPAGTVELVSRDDLLIKGDHNVSNALAAAAAAHAFGVPASELRAGLRTFEPIEHRLEPAGVVDGVEYYNDSKATNPDAVLKALTAFGERPLVVLLGGRGKGTDFSELASAVAQRAKAAVLFGEARGEFEAAFTSVGGPESFQLVAAGDLADAVLSAARVADAGDAVLLSPACTSFDEFADYTERGRAFKQLVAQMGKGDGPHGG